MFKRGVLLCSAVAERTVWQVGSLSICSSGTSYDWTFARTPSGGIEKLYGSRCQRSSCERTTGLTSSLSPLYWVAQRKAEKIPAAWRMGHSSAVRSSDCALLKDFGGLGSDAEYRRERFEVGRHCHCARPPLRFIVGRVIRSSSVPRQASLRWGTPDDTDENLISGKRMLSDSDRLSEPFMPSPFPTKRLNEGTGSR